MSHPGQHPPLQHIVSLAPSATQIICELGGRNRLVGVTRWCKQVAPVADLPTLGDCWSANARKLAALAPDLVIGSVPYKPEVVTSILRQGLTFLAMNPRRLADVFNDIQLLGRLLGQERRAQQLVNQMRAQLDAIARRARRAPTRPSIYCEAWPNPLLTSPPWVKEIVHLTGGRFVPGPAGRKVKTADVLAAKPQVILLAWAGKGMRSDPKNLLARSRWDKLPAVRNRQIYIVHDALLNTPAPILTQGALALAQILHPDIFSHHRIAKWLSWVRVREAQCRRATQKS